MLLYHASPVGGLKMLTPRVSNHGRALVYLSERRENVLVYLSNAVEKYCRETGFAHAGRWEKWGPYGFDPDGVQRLEEYYPNALEETYAGVSGYLYAAEHFCAPPRPCRTCRSPMRRSGRCGSSRASSCPTLTKPLSGRNRRVCCAFCAIHRQAARGAGKYAKSCGRSTKTRRRVPITGTLSRGNSAAPADRFALRCRFACKNVQLFHAPSAARRKRKYPRGL